MQTSDAFDQQDAPILLLDNPEDGGCDEQGWVRADVAQNAARDLLAEFCVDADGHSPARPTAEAVRVTLALVDASAHVEDQRWLACDETAAGAVAYWEFDVSDIEPVGVSNA
jgi:hypothetical protein